VRAQPGKRALIVAVGEYAPSSGWEPISSENDVPLIRAALESHGFGSIATLTGPVATREGILEAARRELLEPAGPGDVVVFHYSGHGHQITDNDGDEIDGYDEVLVPYDAPAEPPSDYDGSRHVRDDDLGNLVQELRRRVGPSGNVIVVLDACHSGSATRGRARTRGPRPGVGPIGPPAETARDEAERGGGGFAEGRPGSRGPAPAGDELAPYVVFSAARSNQYSQETEDAEGNVVGSLSLALSQALLEAGESSTYRGVFEAVQRHMANTVPTQNPQAEGDIDTRLFSGRAVSQAPYFTVQRVIDGEDAVVVRGGSVRLLFEGTTVAFHSPGTIRPDEGSALATGTVTRTRALDSRVDLHEGSPGPDELLDTRVFVVEQAFGPLGLTVRIDGFEGEESTRIRQALEAVRVVDVVGAAADIRVALEDGRVVAETGLTGGRIAGPLSRADPGWEDAVADRVRDFVKNLYLRRLELEAPAIATRFEIRPIELRCGDDGFGGRSCEVAREVPLSEKRSTGGTLRFTVRDGPVRDGFRIVLENEGEEDAYVYLLDLTASGDINLLWPLRRASDNQLEAGESYEIDIDYLAAAPFGIDVIKLFATSQPADLDLLVTRREGLTRSPRGPFEGLFADVFTGTRNVRPDIRPGAAHTFSQTIQVVGENPQ
jgi:hypothetical protein